MTVGVGVEFTLESFGNGPFSSAALGCGFLLRAVCNLILACFLRSSHVK